MKKYFIKVAEYIQAKIDKFVIKRFTQILPTDLITSLYRKIVERDLLISTRAVFVKKGKIKYTLMIIKDRNLETVYNLGRHYTQEPKLRTA
jgi:hypothetical protein